MVNRSLEWEESEIMDEFLFSTLFFSSLPFWVIGPAVFSSRAATHFPPRGRRGTRYSSTTLHHDHQPRVAPISWQGKMLHHRSRKILFVIRRRFVRDRRCRRPLCTYDPLYRAAGCVPVRRLFHGSIARPTHNSRHPIHTDKYLYSSRRNCYYRG